MSIIIQKAQRAAEITGDTSRASWQRILPALEELSGLMMSDLSPSAKTAFEAQLVAFNRITHDNGIEEAADYEKMVDSVTSEVLECILTMTRLCISSGGRVRFMEQVKNFLPDIEVLC